ncbi:MAG: YceI family protein [Chloroflexi bacterium]|nr:YceI family protein [Chloroflexota bacterium]
MPAGAIRVAVVPQESKATFRVREQLAGISFPSDAVGTTGAVTGQLVLQPDGSIVADVSKVSVDLRDLKTDDARRDNYIKRTTIQVDRFPTAEFVPTKADGLPSPLPASGEHSFTLTGLMTLHGVQKELTRDVKAKREGPSLTGTATTSFTFGDFGMAIPRVPLVLSIVDEIRLEVDLVAREASA